MDTSICKLLEQAKTIAVIGAKDKEGSDVDRVGRYLIQAGYQVIPVHPVRKNVWGLPTWPHLGAVPEPIDIVNVFRAPDYCLGHAQECLSLTHRPTCFWMQSGIASQKAASLLQAEGLAVVENSCIMVEHAACFGKEVPARGFRSIGRL